MSIRQTYKTRAVLLKPAQRELLLKAVQNRTGANIRVPNYAISDPNLGSDHNVNESAFIGEGIAGGVRIPLTSRQINRFTKNTKLSRGVDLKLSKTQMSKFKKHGSVEV